MSSYVKLLTNYTTIGKNSNNLKQRVAQQIHSQLTWTSSTPMTSVRLYMVLAVLLFLPPTPDALFSVKTCINDKRPLSSLRCRARFRENRSIFNTPNPRLMNASLFKDSKLLSPARGDRRGSKASVRVPSRAPSVTSVNAGSRSPNGSLAKG